MNLIEDMPENEPVTLDDAKAHLRITHDADDDAIAALVKTARQICEEYTGLALITRDCRLYLDQWPKHTLSLPKPPLVNVAAINVYDAGGDASAFPAAGYAVDTIGRPGRIEMTGAPPWPGQALSGIEIEFSAGFGASADDVPQDLREGIKRLVAHLYMNRGDAGETAIRNAGAGNLFAAYRRLRLS
ncbi:MAG: head-tail connector protein [bacterium]|nr:head-tail connector protein [bacterium]